MLSSVVARTVRAVAPDAVKRANGLVGRCAAAAASGVSPSSAFSSTSPAHQDAATAKTNKFGSPLPEVVEKHGWEGAWTKGVTPWDAGKSTPLLPHLLANGVLPAGDVLVPGCGGGYDVFTFAKAGRKVVGLDLAPTPIQRCKGMMQNDRDLAKLEDLASFEAADFFQWNRAKGGPFSVIWDYTFVNALPPSLWGQWAQSCKRLLKAPKPDGTDGGQLALLMFPIGDYEGGPPFAMNPSKFRALMEENDFELVDEMPVPNDLSFKARAGREVFTRWQLNSRRFPSSTAPFPRKKPVARLANTDE